MCLDWDPVPTPHFTWWICVVWRESTHIVSASGTRSPKLAFRHLLDLPKRLGSMFSGYLFSIDDDPHLSVVLTKWHKREPFCGAQKTAWNSGVSLLDNLLTKSSLLE